MDASQIERMLAEAKETAIAGTGGEIGKVSYGFVGTTLILTWTYL